jgi:nucleoid-associated protein EbfC
LATEPFRDAERFRLKAGLRTDFLRSVMKLPGGMNLQQMMKQAQKMQEQMMKEMETLRVDSTAGGGIVKVEMNGLKEVISVKIEPEAAGDIEMLQDLIVAAVNECGRKVDESANNRLGGVLGGLNIPGLM